MDREILDALVESLNDPNAGWEFDKYYARNRRIRCDIWLANGPGYIDVDFYGPKIFGERWGIKTFKVTGTLLFHPSWARRLYKVARPLQLAALGSDDIKVSTKIVAAIQSASAEVA